MESLRASPLRVRLIFAIGLTVLASVITLVVVGYRETKSAVRGAALARLTNVAGQVARSTGQGTRAWLGRLDSVSRLPAVVAALTNPDRADVEAAVAALRPLGPDTGSVVATALRDTSGTIVAALGGILPAEMGTPADSTTVSGLFVVDGVPMYGTSAPVRTREGDPVGHVVQVRQLVGGANLQAQVALLAGPQGRLLLGNPDGSVWTDFERLVNRPPVEAAGAEYVRDGVARLAAAASLDRMPMVFAVEVPSHVALGPATAMLRTFAGVGLIAVGVGVVVAWLIGRAIARPLDALAAATGPVALGAPMPENLPVGRRDEIGSLARSFQAMADRVRAARATLEGTVAERTEELSHALQELRETQDTLLRKERLATLGQLAGSVGHELRNPLGVMTNAVYYLEASQPEAPPKVKEYLAILRNQIRISEKIVSDLLDFGRIRQPQLTAVDFPAFIDEELARAQLPESVRVERSLDGISTLILDPIQIGQVLHNLFTNAAQALDGAPGTIRITAGRLNSMLWVEVADSGPGIAEADLPKIFEPLFTTRARGIGLGLAVSRGLARANGGDLTVRSGHGQGARFVLELPLADQA